MNSPLVVDSTGVGNSVVEMLETAGLSASICPYVITAGAEPGNGTVSKKDIVASILVPLQTGQLKIARQLEHADTLVHELETFRVRVTEFRNEIFSADKESDHDDFVTALGLAMWYGAKHSRYSGCYSIDAVPNSPPPIKRKVWDGGEARKWGFRGTSPDAWPASLTDAEPTAAGGDVFQGTRMMRRLTRSPRCLMEVYS